MNKGNYAYVTDLKEDEIFFFMSIANYIKRDFLTTGPFTLISSIWKKFLQEADVVILEDNHFYGVLTRDDLVDKLHILAIDCLTAKAAVEKDASINYTLQLMDHSKASVLPVMADNKIYGLVYKKDLIDHFKNTGQELPVNFDEEIESLRSENKELREFVQQQKLDIESIIEKRTEELKESIKAKEKFIKIIAHELRSPFTSILGFLDLMKSNLRQYDIDTIEKFLTHIRYSTTATYDLLVNLLNWLNARNKRVPHHPEETEISRHFIEGTLASSLFAAEQKNIKIEFFISENLFAFVDGNMFRVILRNLVNNAIKFTNEGGKIEIFATLSDEFIEFNIQDTGIGLSKEAVENLFKSEVIMSVKGTASETGTGFGLLLCQEFVEIGHGKIWVESVLGTGSNFKFTIPKVIVAKGSV